MSLLFGSTGRPDLLGGLEAYPAYYVHMAPANAAGPSEPELSMPDPARPEVLRERIEAGEWVVDLRTRTAFAAGHVPGTLNFGLDGRFSTYLGWLIEWGTPVTLLGEAARATFGDLSRVRHHRDVVVLDVRRAQEFEGARIDGADRASVAASFLAASRREPVAIHDSFENAEPAGLHLISAETRTPSDPQAQ